MTWNYGVPNHLNLEPSVSAPLPSPLTSAPSSTIAMDRSWLPGDTLPHWDDAERIGWNGAERTPQLPSPSPSSVPAGASPAGASTGPGATRSAETATAPAPCAGLGGTRAATHPGVARRRAVPGLAPIPSSRASPVLGPTKAGLVGLGLLSGMGGIGFSALDDLIKTGERGAVGAPGENDQLAGSDSGDDSGVDADADPDAGVQEGVEDVLQVDAPDRIATTAVDPPRRRYPSPLTSVVPLLPAPRPRGPIHAGAAWTGTQRNGRAAYDVSVTFTHADMDSGVAGGYLTIKGLTPALPLLRTYFDAEIIGSKYGFLTDKWGASEADDQKHWSRFPLFRTIAKPHLCPPSASASSSHLSPRLGGTVSLLGSPASFPASPPLQQQQLGEEDLWADWGPGGTQVESAAHYHACRMLFPGKNRQVVFMRWKERFVVPDHRLTDISGASFAGFYYVCCDLSPQPEPPAPIHTASGSRPRRSSSSHSVCPPGEPVPRGSGGAPPPLSPRPAYVRPPTSGGPQLHHRSRDSHPQSPASVRHRPPAPTPASPPAAPNRPMRASTPSGFSYAAMARRNSSSSLNGGQPGAVQYVHSQPAPGAVPEAMAGASEPKAEDLQGTVGSGDAAAANFSGPVSATTRPELDLSEFPPPPASPRTSPPVLPAASSASTIISSPSRPRRLSSAPSLGTAGASSPLPPLGSVLPGESPASRGRSGSHAEEQAAVGSASCLAPGSGPAGAGGDVRTWWQNAKITAFYFHATSEPYQELVLRYQPRDRGGLAAYEFC